MFRTAASVLFFVLSLRGATVHTGAFADALSSFKTTEPGCYGGEAGSLPVSACAGRVTIGDVSIAFHGGTLDGGPVPDGPGPVVTTLSAAEGQSVTEHRQGRIRYRGVYPGVDLLLTLAHGTLKSEYAVAPHADPTRVRISYEGASAHVADGRLQITGWGTQFEEASPLAYQEETPRGRLRVSAQYQVFPDGTVGFSLGRFDSSLPLIIDPYVLSSGRFLGGSGLDHLTGLTTDAAGNIYVTGWTESPDLPVTGGLGWQPASGTHGFIAKLTSTASQVIYATYFGGHGYDQPAGIVVDTSGNAYVAGYTTSYDLPVAFAAQSNFRGVHDGFVLKLNAAGNALLFCTYFGGSGSDNINGLALGTSGDVWVAGDTDSTDLTVLNPLQAANAGRQDGFVAHFSASGTLLSSTYLGGSGTDIATAIAVDSNGSVLVTGSTTTGDFPVHNAALAYGGLQDAFVTKLNTTASAIVFSTFLGGNGGGSGLPESGNAVVSDGSGGVIVAGVTSSTNFPVAAATQAAFGGGTTDGFVSHFSSTGALVSSTYLGGLSTDDATSLARGTDGSVYVSGYTSSGNWPLVNALQSSLGGNYDGFVLKFSPGLSGISFSSYLGGLYSDSLEGLALSGSAIVVGGSSASPALFPASTFSGLQDAVLARIDPTFNVTLDSSPIGFVLTISGSNCPAGNYTTPSVVSIAPGVSCTITAPATQAVTASAQYAFSSWSDGTAASARTVTPTTDMTFRALYNQQFAISGSGAPPIAGTALLTPPSSSGYYNAGSAITVTAVPNTGYQFAGWSGIAAGGANPLTLTVTGSGAATAVFGCNFSLSATTVSATAASSSPAVALTAGSSCPWAASSNSSWISVSPASGQGSASVVLTLSPNAGDARSGTATIAGQTVTVTQAAAGCSYVLNTTSIAVGQSGGSGTISLSAPAGCAWSITSDSAWLTINGAVSGAGSANITYRASVNPGGLRVGTLSLLSQKIVVTQAGPTTAGLPELVSVDPAAGRGNAQTFTAVYSDPNGWSALTSVTLALNAGFTKNGGCYLQVAPNQGTVSLWNDAGTATLGSVALGTAASLENSVCRVDAAASSFQGSGTNLQVSLAISFKAAAAASYRIFLAAADANGTADGLCFGGWWTSDMPASLVNRYRLFDPFSRSHLDTTDVNEYNVLGTRGFTQEGVTGRIYDGPASAGGVPAVPLYRIYVAPGLSHFWTTDRNEYLTLIKIRGYYVGEGIDGFVFSTAVAGSVPLYRLVFNFASPPIHLWTTDANENKVLGGSGAWTAEGVAAYEFPP